MSHFPSTHWSLVRMAGTGNPTAAEALERLCHAYWPAIYGFVRRKGFAPHDAEDLTQEFFARILRRELVTDANPHLGRFRTFLLHALSDFLVDERRKASREKRGGGSAPLSIEGSQEEERFLEIPDPAATNPADCYDRRWRLSLLQQALRRLEAEFAAANKSRHFTLLKEFLTGPAMVGAYATVGAALGAEPRTVAVMVHRLRRRFRELVREEVAHTVTDPAMFEDELRQLFG
jgi:RNA polymerase sigma factor (sigma-70 family)